MKRLALLAALLVVPSGAAGSYVPPPWDASPTWSPDGAEIGFITSRAGPAIAAVDVATGRQRRIYDGQSHGFAFSPDWRSLALVVPRQALTLILLDLTTGAERELARDAWAPAWSPDGRTIAFSKSGRVLTMPLAGGAVRDLAAGTGPVFSPDGTRLAYVGGPSEQPHLHLVGVDGTGDVDLTPDEAWSSDGPAWSLDGRSVAFWRWVGSTSELVVADAATGKQRTIELDGHAPGQPFAWLPDGRIAVAGAGGLYVVDPVQGRKQRRAAFGNAPALSPAGTRLALASGGECRDRVGVYVLELAAARAKPRRLTNDCRIRGSAGRDVLRGSPLADVLLGLAGDDRLAAYDPGYVGDTLLGGAGNDFLFGDYRSDTLDGGPGSDNLYGGPSADALTGGPGRDLLSGEGGRDRIFARDGRTDTIRCGTNGPGTPERDEVFADVVDDVGVDCERVHRF